MSRQFVDRKIFVASKGKEKIPRIRQQGIVQKNVARKGPHYRLAARKAGVLNHDILSISL